MSHPVEHAEVVHGSGPATNDPVYENGIDELWNRCVKDGCSPNALQRYYNSVLTLRRELGVGNPSEKDPPYAGTRKKISPPLGNGSRNPTRTLSPADIENLFAQARRNKSIL